MAVHGAVRFDVRYRRQIAVLEIGEQIGDVTHMVGAHRRIVQLIFKRVADVAIESIERRAGPRNVVTAAIIFPRNVLRAQEIADAGHSDRRNRTGSAWRALRRPGRVDVDSVVIVTRIALCLDRITQLAKAVLDWLYP